MASVARAGLSSSSILRKKVSDPLRVLFCGSDDFSCQSLRALHREHERDRNLIQSIDVMVRQPKRVGRKLQSFSQAPCKIEAQRLGLRIHERDTFTGWDLPSGVNLVIAVAFGLFVPPRILKSAKYGGLNVHPSLLPHLRGPAPVHHALLRGDEYTGVSLQTLSPVAFDHGAILAQTPAPGIPISQALGLTQATALLGDIGAEMLVQGLRDAAHVPPYQEIDVSWNPYAGSGEQLAHAPKVGKDMAGIDWTRWRAEDFQRRLNVFGELWTHVQDANKTGAPRRAILSGIDIVHADQVHAARKGGHGVSLAFTRSMADDASTSHVVHIANDERGSLFVNLPADEGRWMRVRKVQLDGKSTVDATQALQRYLTPKEAT